MLQERKGKRENIRIFFAGGGLEYLREIFITFTDKIHFFFFLIKKSEEIDWWNHRI